MTRGTQIVIAAVLLGACAAGLWVAFRPSATTAATPEAAKRAGFSSPESYARSLALIDEMSKSGRLSSASMEHYRRMATSEGENGELLSLTIMLPAKERDQRKEFLRIATKALLNPEYQPLPSRVLSSYRTDTPDLVDEFIARHPEAQLRLEGK